MQTDEDAPRIHDDDIGLHLVIEDQARMIRWLARELAKWELVTDGVMVTDALIDEYAKRCIEAAKDSAQERKSEEEHA
jgi:hypothetical protein